MEKLKEWWETQEPSAKRNYLLLGLAAVVLVVIVASPTRKPPERPDPIERPETDVLADDRGAGDITTLAAENRTIKAQLAELRRVNQEMNQQMVGLRQAVGAMSKLKEDPEQVAALLDSINQMQLDVENLKEDVGRSERAGQRGGQLLLGVDPANGNADPARNGGEGPLEDPFSNVDREDDSVKFDPLASIKPVTEGATGRHRADRTRASQESGGSRFDFVREGEARPPPVIRIEPTGESGGVDSGRSGREGTGARTSRDVLGARIAAETEAPTVYVPATTLFKGFLLNGMDAPTGQTSSQEPHPVTIRVSSLAFLPNRFSTNIKDCFVLAGGFGNLASERVQLRTERLSCVRTDGTVIDVPLDGYISGEDGKVGLRGTVVNRTGALLARAALSGIASGFADAIQPRQIQSVQTGGGAGTIDFQAPPTGEVLEIGAYRGAANAMQALSQYYLERASEIFPIIELDALRPVTIHMTQGVELRVREQGAWQADAIAGR